MTTTTADVSYTRAPRGGATSDVNGQWYEGGQWMPIHGNGKAPSPREPRKKWGPFDGLWWDESQAIGYGVGSILMAWQAQRHTHVGVVGKRCEMRLRHEYTHSFETQYGRKSVVNFRDVATGSRVTWFTSSPWGFDEDRDITVKATVTEHGEYDGEPQTLVSRLNQVD